MCDKAEYQKIRERVEQLEKNSVKFDQQLRTLFNSTQVMFRIVCIAGFMMLLALIYGAIGQKGFNAVTHSASEYSGSHGQWSSGSSVVATPTK